MGIKMFKLPLITLIEIDRLKQFHITPDDLDFYLKYMNKLPRKNKNVFFIRGSKNHLVEIIGLKGTVKKIGVDKVNNGKSELARGVFYFDGNRIGKKKRIIVEQMFNNTEIMKSCNPKNIWNKVRKQSNF